MLMDQVETVHVCGYWSEILCCTITTHLSDLEVKVMGFDKFSGKAQIRRATLSCDSSYFLCEKRKIFSRKFWIFFLFYSKHRLWVHIRNASARQF